MRTEIGKKSPKSIVSDFTPASHWDLILAEE
jgi:hypothetical protein